MNKSRTLASERTTYRDRETGHTVVQLTSGPHYNGACYVSHHGVTADDREVVFSSNRTGGWEFYRVDVQTGAIQQLTDNGVRADDQVLGQPYKVFDLCATTHTLYYMADRELRALDLNNLAEDMILTIPAGTHPDYPHVNQAGTWLALGYVEAKPASQCRPGGTRNRLSNVLELRYRHPGSTILAVDLRADRVVGVWGETEWLDHIQIHPTEPLVLFCREGWPAYRAHLVGIDHDFNKQPRLLLPHQKPGIELTSHELFCPSGEALFGLIERTRPNAATEAERIASEVGQIAFIQPDGEGFLRYRPPYRVPGHVVARSSQDAIIGNAAFLAADDPDGSQRIGRFEPRGGGGFDLVCAPLCRHDATGEHFSGEPHPTLTHDGRRTIFSSAMGQRGQTHLFMMDVFP